MSTTAVVTVEISPGELIDKITILEIKLENITDAIKRANVKTEWEVLTAAKERSLPDSAELTELTKRLKEVNQALWTIEDDIRDCERAKDFGDKFIQLARAVYIQNDHRADVKKKINLLLGSTLIEEKSYAKY
jgi:hypothetical protein